MTIAANHFDTLGYVKKAKELGMPEQLAEFNARQFEESEARALELSKNHMDGRELTTKSDLLKLQIKIMLMMGTGFVTLAAIMAKGFHWF